LNPEQLKAQIWNEDCIPGMKERLEDNSIDLCVSSIPFGALFMYSGKTEDIGNNQDGVELDEGQFGLHMRFCISELMRVMKPGTNVCIHIQQLLRYKVTHGYMGRRDFRGSVISMFCLQGFQYHGEFAISKNPQIIANRQHLHCLAFATGKKNSRMLAPAVCDFVLIFQKPGESVPVRAIYDKKENPEGWLSTEEWIRDAHGVWTDIAEIDTLDGWRAAKAQQEERHVCPLQLEVIRRLVRLYTNIGDTVLDPFMGIGSVAYVSLEQGCNSVGFELKESYWRMAQANIEKARKDMSDADTQTYMFKNMEGSGNMKRRIQKVTKKSRLVQVQEVG
jgi:DNA modification methylase